jgi:3'-phosphoadenosine 5'-phosphosulfate sulfotransferase (PAPS reductase)/FAD synthetase
MRVFPLSNRTEQDVWEYIAVEEIDVVPLNSPRCGRWSDAVAFGSWATTSVCR